MVKDIPFRLLVYWVNKNNFFFLTTISPYTLVYKVFKEYCPRILNDKLDYKMSIKRENRILLPKYEFPILKLTKSVIL